MGESYASAYQNGRKTLHTNKLFDSFLSRKSAGWACITFAFTFQIIAVILVIDEIQKVSDKTENVSSYIIQNQTQLSLPNGNPRCSLDYAFQSPAQPPLVRKTDFTSIVFKIILLVSSTLLCAIGMAILGKNPFKP